MAKCVYEVTEKTFFGGILYEPNGKRPYIVTEEPLKKVPAHLKLLRKKAEVDAALGSQSDPEAEAKKQTEHEAELAALEADSRGPEEL